MMKKHILLTAGFFASILTYGQVGINTMNPDPSSILHIEGKGNHKGVLFPRIDNILSLNNQFPIPVGIVPKDGLLLYSKNLSGNPSGHFYSWNATSSGFWNKELYFAETPKVAFIGFINDTPKLDNVNVGSSNPLVGTGTAPNNYTVKESGYMPLLRFVSSPSKWYITLPPGSYEMLLSLTFNAPVPNAGRGETINADGYYIMGYYNDMRTFPYDPAYWPSLPPGMTSSGNTRLETAVLSKANANHTVTFLHSFTITGRSAIGLDVGRMSGSTHRDLTNLVAADSYIEIIKLK